jgi:hypothetical protein
MSCFHINPSSYVRFDEFHVMEKVSWIPSWIMARICPRRHPYFMAKGLM